MSFGVNTNIMLDTYQRLTSCNGIFLDLESFGEKGKVKVNVNPNSPYFLLQNNEKYFLLDENGTEIVDSVSRQGSQIKSNIFAPQLEGVVAIGLFNCAIPKEEKCKFCAAGEYDGLKYSEDIFTQELERIQKVENIKAITVNAGSLITKPDRGYALMSPFIRILKNAKINEINLELMPPDMNSNELETLLGTAKEDGVTSMQFNLEVWDPKKRKEIMPYKGQISRNVYLNTISKASNIFGPGKISSVLMAGIDSDKELREGAFEVMDAGGIPSIEPFRPLPNTPLEKSNPNINYRNIIQLTGEIISKLQTMYGVDIKKQFEGCLKCSGCNIY
ncbi:MAG: hypothetical protein ABIB43_03470 [archaeon]